MWRYFPHLLERPVPRYTSYPTAADFNDRVGAPEMAEALDRVAAGTAVSLYVHIPFCEQICWYCGCNTNAANRQDRLSAYLGSLLREAELVAERLGGRAKISQIAFGGGSPNALSAAQFEELAWRIERIFDASAAVRSVEIDPRAMTRDWVAAMQGIGVTKASLGVQTFSPHVQKAIGRIQPIELVEQVAQWLRDAGVQSINFDLMYGLPGQSLGDLRETVRNAINFGPDRVALFGYAHVPHVIPRQRRIDATGLPDARSRFVQARTGYDMLKGAGYAPIGFDHFAGRHDPMAKAARQGRIRRNFQGFTDDPASIVIGLGATAISCFPDRILQNEKNSGRWRASVDDGRFPIERGVIRSAEDQLRGRIIESLLCSGGACLSALADMAAIRERLTPYIDHDLVALDQDSIRLLEGAEPYARSIASCFDSYRQTEHKRFSNAC